jgi:hypothetical protein
VGAQHPHQVTGEPWGHADLAGEGGRVDRLAGVDLTLKPGIRDPLPRRPRIGRPSCSAVGTVAASWSAGLDRLALPVGLAAAAAVGWRLRFRVSRDTRAWRDGARGKGLSPACSAAWVAAATGVFHDVAVPGSDANTGAVGYSK